MRGTQAGDDIVASHLLQVPHARGMVAADDMLVPNLVFSDPHGGFGPDLLETRPHERTRRAGTTHDDMRVKLTRARSAVLAVNRGAPGLIGYAKFT